MAYIITGIIVLVYIFFLSILNIASREDDDLESLFKKQEEGDNVGEI